MGSHRVGERGREEEGVRERNKERPRIHLSTYFTPSSPTAVVTHYKNVRSKTYENFLKEVPDLKKLSKVQLARVADALEEEAHPKGDVIIREGEKGDYFFIVEKGTVEFSKKGEGVVGEATVGGFFGELALLKEDTRYV